MAMAKIVIIGGGVSGLVALRHLKDVADVVLYECRSSVGGLWSLSKDSTIDRAEEGNLFFEKYGCQFRNIFDHLAMNSPNFLAQFKDAPHEDDDPPFFTREQFSGYVNRYVERFGLMDNIQTNTFVLQVRQIANLKTEEISHYQIDKNGRKTFIVETCDATSRKPNPITQADYVIIANGHNHVPIMPDWPGLDAFNGQILHSHDFRNSHDPAYVKKILLVVGAGYSGYDMLLQFFAHPIHGEANIKKMYICGKVSEMAKTTDFLPWIKSGKLELIDGTVASLSKNKVKLTNGQEISVDILLPCTGYKFALPFLEKEPDLISQSHNTYCGPLYKKTICINNPNLFFVGNIDKTCLLQKMMEFQCMAIKALISGDITLPSKEEMLADLEKSLRNFQGDAKRNFFKPDDCTKESMDIIEELFELFPELRKYSKFINSFEDATKALVVYFKSGNLIQTRATNFKELVPDFHWDRT